MDKTASSNVIVSTDATRCIKNKPGWRRFVPSFTSIFLTIYIVVSLILNGGFSPFIKRGFFCNDSSINYPVKPDTVSFKWLIVIALIIPSIVVRFCDNRLATLSDNCGSPLGNSRNCRIMKRMRKKVSDSGEIEAEEEKLMATTSEKVKRRSVSNDNSSDNETINSETNHNNIDSEGEESNSFNRIPINSEAKEDGVDLVKLKQPVAYKGKINNRIALSNLQLFLFGFGTTAFFTGIGKVTVGRLRPHFMARCAPRIHCFTSKNHLEVKYHENFECINDLTQHEMSYITTSWPSGHASIMFFSMLFMIVYLHTVIPAIFKLNSKRTQTRFNPLILYAVYVLMIGLACFVSLTRISDYHHHPLDVFSGSLIGTFIALALAIFELRPLIRKNFSAVH